MPSQVRIISGTRNKAFDAYVQDVIDRGAWEKEHDYFGITNPERADEVRRRMKQAGNHLSVSVKAYWTGCNGCKDGGPDCRYHVRYTIYDKDKARRYKASQARNSKR